MHLYIINQRAFEFGTFKEVDVPECCADCNDVDTLYEVQTDGNVSFTTEAKPLLPIYLQLKRDREIQLKQEARNRSKYGRSYSSGGGSLYRTILSAYKVAGHEQGVAENFRDFFLHAQNEWSYAPMQFGERLMLDVSEELRGLIYYAFLEFSEEGNLVAMFVRKQGDDEKHKIMKFDAPFTNENHPKKIIDQVLEAWYNWS